MVKLADTASSMRGCTPIGRAICLKSRWLWVRVPPPLRKISKMYTEEQKEYHRNYYHSKRRPELLALVGDSCKNCGKVDNLEFDHVEPELKSFSINSNMTASNEEVLEELKKCQLLCKDCHLQKTTEEQLSRGYTHGTLYGWMKVHCKCHECLEARNLWYAERNAKRRVAGGKGQYGLPSTHGEIKHYRRGCRCRLCKDANAANAREHRNKVDTD